MPIYTIHDKDGKPLPEPKERIPTKVISWWDKHQRLWTTYLADDEGVQLCDAEYDNTKEQARKTQFQMVEEQAKLGRGIAAVFEVNKRYARADCH